MHFIQLRRSLAAALVFLFPFQTFAATRTWDGGGTDNNWSTAENWSDDTIPRGGDTALFDGTGQTDAYLDAAFVASGGTLQTTTAFTGSIFLRRNYTLNNNLLLSGGTLDMSGTGYRLTVKGSWVNDGATFEAGTGSVVLTGSGTDYTLREAASFNNLSLDDGLIGYWKLDEGGGTVAIDSSRNGINGTIVNNPTWVANPDNGISFYNPYALRFAGHGTNDRIDLPDTSALRPSRGITIGMWVNSVNNGGAFIHHGGNNTYQIWGGSNNGILITTSAGAANLPLPSASLPKNTWYHIAFTYDGAALTLYVNGDIRDSVAATGTLSYPNHSWRRWAIGGYRSGGSVCCGSVSTYDDVRIYNRALSHSEIQQLAGGQQGTGSGHYTLGSPLAVDGNLNIYSGTLDVSSSSHNITASGSFANIARFIPRSATLTLNGIATTLKMYGTDLYSLTITSGKSAVLRTAAAIINAIVVPSASTLTLNGHTLTASTATISNNGLIVEGTGAIIHPSRLAISPPAFGIGDSLHVSVTDADANLDGTTQDTLIATVGGESVTLTETTNTSGIFTGSISTATGPLSTLTRCTYVDISYTDPQDLTDTRTAQSLIIDPSSSCTNIDGEAAVVSGGGRRTSPASFSSSSAPTTSVPSVSSAPSAPSPSARFSDTPPSAWFTPSVEALTTRGIISGYTDAQGNLTGEFGPADPVTVGQIIKIALLSGGHDLPIPAGIPQNPTATDWSAPYIALAESLSITLSSEDVIRSATRGEVITALLEAFGMQIDTGEYPFTDLLVNHPHAQAISTAYELGLVTGDTDSQGNPLNTVRPDDEINRAEVAALVMRMLGEL